MIAIILNRRITEDQSIIADLLNENGDILKIKFPGILKSAKRSAYNVVPGALWEITLAGNPKPIQIPRESNFVSSPFGVAPTYRELELIHEMLSPVNALLPGDRYPEIFVFLQPILNHWGGMSLPEKEFAVSKFILFIFSRSGFYHPENICFVCSSENFPSAGYFLHKGHICPICAGKITVTENEVILRDWLKILEEEKVDLNFPQEKHASARQLILQAISLAHT